MTGPMHIPLGTLLNRLIAPAVSRCQGGWEASSRPRIKGIGELGGQELLETGESYHFHQALPATASVAIEPRMDKMRVVMRNTAILLDSLSLNEV
jgi:hypothetical protein